MMPSRDSESPMADVSGEIEQGASPLRIEERSETNKSENGESRSSEYLSPLGYLLIGIVRIYQFLLSPLLGRNCRFHPTCSEYFILAVRKHGGLKGTWKGLGRIARCHPFHPGGVDYP